MNDRITIVIFMAFLTLVIGIALPLSAGIKLVMMLLIISIGTILTKLVGLLHADESNKK